jgi:EAL domain-containing protein (putative c-di-GMP-specific phosphodiesterase class I)/ActR/RegA family two-component response regulator
MRASMDGLPAAFTALVVDDDAFARGTMRRALRKLGASEVFEAAHGREALDRLSERPSIDVILCDLNMPEVDGIETLRQLAALRLGHRIILASGADPRVLRSAKEMAAHFGLESPCAITKPVTVGKLRQALSDARQPEPVEEPAVSAAVGAEDFLRGFAAQELTAHFQPKVSMATGALIGAEALVRWRHPIYGVLPPASFMEMAHPAGLFDALTDSVLAAATAQCAQWNRNGLDISVGINLPVDSVASRELPDRIDAIVSAQGLEPHHLVLEVTEDGWLNDASVAREVLTRLRVRGYGLAIDDYGTRYATAQQLLDAPFNELKIAQAFVRRALQDRESAVVLSAITAMAHKLKIAVVAEGIESAEQWTHLRALGCDMAQGYFVAPAMPGEQLADWAQAWAERRPSLSAS